MPKGKYVRKQRDPFLDRLEAKIGRDMFEPKSKPTNTLTDQDGLIVRFRINPLTLKLYPPMRPNEGDKVLLEEGTPGANIIVSEDWSVNNPLTTMSILLIWEDGYEYQYQIRPTTDKRIGVFALLPRRIAPRLREKIGAVTKNSGSKR